MRNRLTTIQYYKDQLGFDLVADYGDYLLLSKDDKEIHFFLFKDLDPLINYGQVYIRVTEINQFYNKLLESKVAIHPNGPLESKPWGQKEFSLLDPDHNLLTFGQPI